MIKGYGKILYSTYARQKCYRVLEAMARHCSQHTLVEGAIGLVAQGYGNTLVAHYLTINLILALS